MNNMNGYRTALEKGIPFFFTACGEAHPMSKISVEPHSVSCPACMSLAPRAAPQSSYQMVSDELQVDMVDDDLLSDFDAVDGLMGMDTDMAPSSESSSGDNSGEALAQIGPMLEMVMSSFNPDFDEWERWLMPPTDSDHLGEFKADLRLYLSYEERGFLTQLGQMSSMIGAEGLPKRVFSIIHRMASQIAALEVDLQFLHESDAEEDEEDDMNTDNDEDEDVEDSEDSE